MNFMKPMGRASRLQYEAETARQLATDNTAIEKAKIAEDMRQADLLVDTRIKEAKIANPATGLNSENRLERMSALQAQIGQQPTKPTAMGQSILGNFGSSSSVDTSTPIIKPTGMGGLDDFFKPLDVPSMAGGGVIDGAEGDDQVAAEFSDGRPARLEDGEVVLPREFVHQLGVKQLRKAVEAVTGKPMDPTVKEPLPGQGGRGVLSAAQGMTAQQADDKVYFPADTSLGQATARSNIGPGIDKAFAQLKEQRAARKNPVPNFGTGVSPAERMLDSRSQVVPAKADMGGVSPFALAPVLNRAAEANKVRSPVDQEIFEKEQAYKKYAANKGPRNIEIAGRQMLQDTGKALGYEMESDPVLDKVNRAQAGSGAPDSESSRIAQAMQGMQRPRSEQELLNKLAGEGRELSRDGNVFKYKDLSEKRPGYSGVTFSDTIEGAGLGQKTPPAADAQTMEELRGLYKSKGAEQRRAFEAQGLPGQQAELSAPAVTRGERGQNLQMRNALTARDEMMQARAAAVKPADVIAAEKLAYDRQSDAAKIEREDLAGRVKTDSPPLGLSPAAYKSMLVEAKKAGYDLDDADSWLYSVMDPDLEKALSAGKDIPDPKTGELRSPYEVLRQQLLASLGKSQ